jgi:hypothetical protein
MVSDRIPAAIEPVFMAPASLRDDDAMKLPLLFWFAAHRPWPMGGNTRPETLAPGWS